MNLLRVFVYYIGNLTFQHSKISAMHVAWLLTVNVEGCDGRDKC